MARHLYLRNNCNMPFGSVGNHILYLILRVKATIANAVVARSGIMTDDSSITVCANFREFRIFFYFHSPTLVVGEMPVESIHLMKRNEVDVLLYKIHVKKVTRNV